MSLLLMAAAAAAQAPLGTSIIPVDNCEAPVRLEAGAPEIMPGTTIAQHSHNGSTLPVILDDRTDSAMAVSVPTVSYDQPLVMRNLRTGQIIEYPEIVEHRQPASTVTEIRTDAITSTATDMYIVTNTGSGTKPGC